MLSVLVSALLNPLLARGKLNEVLIGVLSAQELVPYIKVLVDEVSVLIEFFHEPLFDLLPHALIREELLEVANSHLCRLPVRAFDVWVFRQTVPRSELLLSLAFSFRDVHLLRIFLELDDHTVVCINFLFTSFSVLNHKLIITQNRPLPFIVSWGPINFEFCNTAYNIFGWIFFTSSHVSCSPVATIWLKPN